MTFKDNWKIKKDNEHRSKILVNRRMKQSEENCC